MPALSRTDNSVVGRWWWTVDKWTLLALFLLAGAGMMMTMAASPSVAVKLGLNPQYFVVRHAMFLPLGLVTMLAVSTLSLRNVRRLALAVFLAAIAMMAMTVMIGAEVKGAARWIDFGGFSIQPSEFVKPAFVVLTAWLLAPRPFNREIPGAAICTLLFTGVIALLLMGIVLFGLAIALFNRSKILGK